MGIRNIYLVLFPSHGLGGPGSEQSSENKRRLGPSYMYGPMEVRGGNKANSTFCRQQNWFPRQFCEILFIFCSFSVWEITGFGGKKMKKIRTHIHTEGS